jgi:hypothetical protein
MMNKIKSAVTMYKPKTKIVNHPHQKLLNKRNAVRFYE